MPEDATPRDPGGGAKQLVVRLAIAAAALGTFVTWTSDGSVRLDGVQGPNNGWLVLLAAAFALAWAGSLARGSWLGVLGVLGAALVIGWTAVADWLDGREIVGAAASIGLLVVVAASVVLGGAAVARAVELVRGSRGAPGLRPSP